MSANSSIEWTDRTWNPVRGCAIVSPGCVNCYAMKQAHRFSGKGKAYEGLTKQTSSGPQWTGKVRTVESALLDPLKWRKPQRVFVNSMSDLFHGSVPFEFVDRVFAVMAFAGRHTFQVLTKRPDRMHHYMTLRAKSAQSWKDAARSLGLGLEFEGVSLVQFPLPNVWLGVSCEDQPRADERIPLLLQTPAAVRFVSAEPLLGPIALKRFMPKPMFHCPQCGVEKMRNRCEKCGTEDNTCTNEIIGLDWVIVGGESGPGARPCDVAWIRSIVRQCQVASVPVFVKQLGSKPIAVEGSRESKEWGASEATGFMDDCGGIHFKNRKGGTTDEWPKMLRVRQFPATEART